jgi:hypothetical protein
MKTWAWAALIALAGLAACGDSNEGQVAQESLSDPDSGPKPSGPHPSDALFLEEEFNDVRLAMSPADWESILWDTMGDTYRRCSMEWKGVRLSDVAIRPSGHATRFPGNMKMSLKLKFDEFVAGQEFLKLDTLKLDGVYEGTMMRERLSYGVYRTRVPATPRAVHCRLFVNDEYRGVYLIEERITKDLLKHRFDGEVGNLYRIMSERPEAFTWLGEDPELYLGDGFEPETHELDGDHTVLVRFLDFLNHFPERLPEVCDVENLLEHLAIEAAIISYDGILRDSGPPQNCYTVYRPSTDRFEFIPWDRDQTMTDTQTTRDLFHNFGNTRIASIVRDTPDLNFRYRVKVSGLIESDAHPDQLAERIDFIYAQIRDAAHADVYKPPSNSSFDRYPDYLKRVARERYESLRAQLAGF